MPSPFPLLPHIKELQVIDLRNYFAGCALQGLLAYGKTRMTKNEITKHCFWYADFMVEESKKGK